MPPTVLKYTYGKPPSADFIRCFKEKLEEDLGKIWAGEFTGAVNGSSLFNFDGLISELAPSSSDLGSAEEEVAEEEVAEEEVAEEEVVPEKVVPKIPERAVVPKKEVVPEKTSTAKESTEESTKEDDYTAAQEEAAAENFEDSMNAAATGGGYQYH